MFDASGTEFQAESVYDTPGVWFEVSTNVNFWRRVGVSEAGTGGGMPASLRGRPRRGPLKQVGFRPGQKDLLLPTGG